MFESHRAVAIFAIGGNTASVDLLSITRNMAKNKHNKDKQLHNCSLRLLVLRLHKAMSR